jgi:hypothetical protein
MKKSLLPYYILFIFIGIVASCKTRKNTIEVKDQVQSSSKTPAQVSIRDNQCEWFDGKFNTDINVDGKPNSVKGRARIRKDSLIWISIKPDIAIIEAFRILISPDSVQLIDYLNKKFFSDQFSAIREFINYDLTFEMIQNIFIGNPTYIFSPNDYKVFTNKTGDEILSSSDFKTYVDARNTNQGANFLFQALWVNNQVHKRNLIYDPKNKVELDLQYMEHEMVDSLMLPKTVQLTVIGDSTNTRFGFTYTKIQLNNSFDFPFSIPGNYERIFLKK